MVWKSQDSKDVNSLQMECACLCNNYQNPSKIFINIDKIILKFIWIDKGTRINNFETEK